MIYLVYNELRELDLREPYVSGKIHLYMKRSLAVFTVLAVVCLSIMGALSAIPHTHGKDHDRATHDSCPICQFSIQGFSATAITFSELVILSFVLFCLVSISTLCSKLSYQLIPARGPPVLI